MTATTSTPGFDQARADDAAAAFTAHLGLAEPATVTGAWVLYAHAHKPDSMVLVEVDYTDRRGRHVTRWLADDGTDDTLNGWFAGL